MILLQLTFENIKIKELLNEIQSVVRQLTV